MKYLILLIAVCSSACAAVPMDSPIIRGTVGGSALYQGGTFVGNGAGLTGVTSSTGTANVFTGTVANSQIPALVTATVAYSGTTLNAFNVVYSNGSQAVYTNGGTLFVGSSSKGGLVYGTFQGNGAGLTNLPGSTVTSLTNGTLFQLTTNTGTLTSGLWLCGTATGIKATGTFIGDGSGLTGVTAGPSSLLNNGTISGLTQIGGTFSGNITRVGTTTGGTFSASTLAGLIPITGTFVGGVMLSTTFRGIATGTIQKSGSTDWATSAGQLVAGGSTGDPIIFSDGTSVTFNDVSTSPAFSIHGDGVYFNYNVFGINIATGTGSIVGSLTTPANQVSITATNGIYGYISQLRYSSDAEAWTVVNSGSDTPSKGGVFSRAEHAFELQNPGASYSLVLTGSNKAVFKNAGLQITGTVALLSDVAAPTILTNGTLAGTTQINPSGSGAIVVGGTLADEILLIAHSGPVFSLAPITGTNRIGFITKNDEDDTVVSDAVSGTSDFGKDWSGAGGKIDFAGTADSAGVADLASNAGMLLGNIWNGQIREDSDIEGLWNVRTAGGVTGVFSANLSGTQFIPSSSAPSAPAVPTGYYDVIIDGTAVGKVPYFQ